MNVTQYRPNETVKQKRQAERREDDMDTVHEAIRRNPGLPGKAAIAEATGLTVARVNRVLKFINDRESKYVPVAFGTVRVHGEDLRGWYAVNLKAHHPTMDHQDEHMSRVEHGVHRRRLTDVERAHAVRGADEVVARMEERLGVDRKLLSAEDRDTFDTWVAAEMAKNGD